ncbi:nucleoside phosphorylase [Aquimarina algicola]|uniref:Uridine phosphorylase n=1 Tax=Aquimarina algicola TaxID=2589995 RepID=A0A504JN73_9FLAO|nr:nucleoside phosphorylase [Aquimarina algicola]TPN89153.1 phosphorylase [Aquimarina algicola]
MAIAESEFILNSDGSIYHLNLKPEHIATTIITVGDPDRVAQITQRFDHIEHTAQKREFCTHTGTYKSHRITVISTGIGTDNIDIVLNELDALVNIDFETREIKNQKTALNVIRIGTSGTIQKDIPIDSFVMSEMAIGFDSLLHFYKSEHIQQKEYSDALIEHLKWNESKFTPYAVASDDNLSRHLMSDSVKKGITVTNVGFYGPQSRVLRLPLKDSDLNKKIASFEYNGKRITNLEMETSGIYGMAKLLGHKAVSMNAILANRATGEFSKDPKKLTNRLIDYTLEKIVAYLDVI